MQQLIFPFNYINNLFGSIVQNEILGDNNEENE